MPHLVRVNLTERLHEHTSTEKADLLNYYIVTAEKSKQDTTNIVGAQKSFHSMSYIRVFYKSYSVVQGEELKHHSSCQQWCLLCSPDTSERDQGTETAPRPTHPHALLTESCLNILSFTTQRPEPGTSSFHPKEPWWFFENLITT